MVNRNVNALVNVNETKTSMHLYIQSTSRTNVVNLANQTSAVKYLRRNRQLLLSIA